MIAPHRKRLLAFSAVYFVVYFIGAAVYFKERIFLDGAYYFFHVVQSQQFHVEHQRFILVPSQLLTWLGVRLHLPLQLVLMLNSLNPVLYFLLLFGVCFYVLKDEAGCWTLLFLGVCGVYFLYFVPMYEVWYGALLLVIFSSMMNRQFYQYPYQLVWLGLVVLTLLFSYPLMIIGFLFFTLYHFLEIRKIPVRVAVFFIVLVFGWLTWKTLFISDYENGKISYPFSRIGITLQENFTPISNIKALFVFLFTVYTESMVMLLIVVVMLLLRKAYDKVFLILAFSGGYILLINITHNFPWNHTNYFERMYLLLIPLGMIPFLREIYIPSRHKRVMEILFVLIILYRGLLIELHAIVYSDRMERIEEFIEMAHQQGGSKFSVNADEYPGDRALNEWSFPMETILFSSMENGNQTVAISLKSDLEAREVDTLLNGQNFHLRLNEVFNDDWLNQQYFHLQHGSYVPLQKLK